jgi:hypothetical protein
VTSSNLLVLAGALVLCCCGGRIDGSASLAPPASTSLPTGGSADPVADTPTYAPLLTTGLWQLEWTTGPNGEDDSPPFLELDLDTNGMAYFWSCLNAPTGNGLPCPTNQRVGCVVGQAALRGDAWHVVLTANDGTTVRGEGDVVEDPSGDVAIDGTGLLPAGGTYHRVAAPAREKCFP